MAIVLTWLDSGEIRQFVLPVGATTSIGPGTDAALCLDGPLAAPAYAAFRVEHGRAFLEGRDGGPSLHVNGRPLDAAAEIADGDVIHAGATILNVHDVSSIRAPGGGLTCRHCSRENGTDQDLCWYCGARVVNAPTVPMVARRAVCRLVPAEGACADLFQGDSYELGEGRAVRGASGRRPAVEARDAGPPWLIAAGDVKRNGESVDGECPVAHGDILRYAENECLVLLP